MSTESLTNDDRNVGNFKNSSMDVSQEAVISSFFDLLTLVAKVDDEPIILVGPVLWIITLSGVALNGIIIPIELISTASSSTAILSTAVSLALLIKSIYLLSIVVHLRGNSVYIILGDVHTSTLETLTKMGS